MTLQTVVDQLNAITEGMFTGAIPCRSSALNDLMKCHPANAFFVSVSAPVRCMQYSSVKHRTRQSVASSRYTVLEPEPSILNEEAGAAHP